MAGFDYGRMTATASRLMARFAQGEVRLVRTVPGVAEPDAPIWEPVPPTQIKTYRLDATAKAVSDKFIDGSLIVATDMEITIGTAMTLVGVVVDDEPVAFEPETVALEIMPGDVVTVDGRPVTILKVMRIPRAGTAIVWKVIARG